MLVETDYSAKNLDVLWGFGHYLRYNRFLYWFLLLKEFLVFSGLPASGDWVVTGTESYCTE